MGWFQGFLILFVLQDRKLMVQCGDASHDSFKGDTEILYKDTLDRVPFYIKIFVMMSWIAHKGLELV